MKTGLIWLTLLLLVYHSLYGGSGRIYGRVITTDDEIFEGWIRWDKQEAFWDDYLDGLRKEYIKTRLDKKIVLKVYGPFMVYRKKGDFRRNPRMSVQFGHVELIQKKSSNSAIITLKDGRKMMVGSYGSDIGNGNRGIEIDDLNFGKISVRWREFKQAEFMKEPSEYRKKKGDKQTYRLYGEVETWAGDLFEGYIMWDKDEALSTDILDGKYRRREMKIPFGNIRSLERDSRTSVVVELRNDKRFSMSGGNDVGKGNRGIWVKDPICGEVEINWEDFSSIKFQKNVTKFLKNYEDFDGGRPLYGEVYTKDNQRYKGYVCWDNDECFTTDVLDGKFEDYEINLEFSMIYSIQYRSRSSAIVETTDGKKMRLSGSNDVNSSNAGIYIMTKEGDETRIRWNDFEKSVFK